MKNEQLFDRLDRLAARLELEGRYVDANIVVSAYHQIVGHEPPVWRNIVDQQWKNSTEKNGESNEIR